MTHQSRRGVAYHEAGHAVVASAVGLQVIEVRIGIKDDPSAGKTCVDPKPLGLTDQLAVLFAGKAAEELFDAPANPRAWHLDRLRVDQLLEQVAEDLRSTQKRAGRARANRILRSHRVQITQLAEYLLRHGAADHSGGLDLLQHGR